MCIRDRGLLTGNSRSSLIEIASHAPDLKKTIDKLVAQGMITKQEGVAAYDEIYAMQIANNNSNGAIMMPFPVYNTGSSSINNSLAFSLTKSFTFC